MTASAAATGSAQPTPTNGYTLVLPPGWAKIPLRAGTDGVIASILDRTFAGHSRDEVAVPRRDLQLRLRDLAAAARQNNGLDLYLPTEQIHGFTLAASFVIAEVSFGAVEPLDPSLLVAALASDGDAKPVMVDGIAGSRAESTAAPDQAREIPFGARRVAYVLPVPGDPDRWVVVTLSTIGQGDPQDDLADLVVELFDAIMSTFRWTSRPAP